MFALAKKVSNMAVEKMSETIFIAFAANTMSTYRKREDDYSEMSS